VYRATARERCPATRHGGSWGERRYSFFSFWTSALDGGKWSASRLGRALPPGIDPRYPLDRRLGGPESRSGRRARRIILCLCRGSNPGRLFCSRTLYYLSYPGSYRATTRRAKHENGPFTEWWSTVVLVIKSLLLRQNIRWQLLWSQQIQCCNSKSIKH
jgi:hypothetical protein